MTEINIIFFKAYLSINVMKKTQNNWKMPSILYVLQVESLKHIFFRVKSLFIVNWGIDEKMEEIILQISIIGILLKLVDD